MRVEMTKRTGVNMKMHACPRCGGAAYLDNLEEPEWRCLQCARVVPVTIAQPQKVA